MANQGAMFYDGVPNNSVLANLVNMVPSPDSVSEFRVQTNSNSAEYGRYSAASSTSHRGRAATNSTAPRMSISATRC